MICEVIEMDINSWNEMVKKSRENIKTKPPITKEVDKKDEPKVDAMIKEVKDAK